MKKITAAVLAFCALSAASVSANAQGDLRALLGFTRGAVNLGADYEMKQNDSFGFGGYFFMQTDEKKNGVTNVPEVIALGAFAPVHLLNNAKVDAYIAPGFGIAMIDDGTEDETTFGPSLKLGVECQVAPTVSVGIQYANYYNWLSDDVAGKTEHTSAAATFSF